MPEVRVSFDDPEVFNLLSERKEELDLSWQEVIFRGLQKEGAPDIEEEVDRLESAEDAVLDFDFFDSTEKRVPVRIRLKTGPNGYEVDRVDIRRGKDVEMMNRFKSHDRDKIAEKLKDRDATNLVFRADKTSYNVEVVLSWGRDEHGRCIVIAIDDISINHGDENRDKLPGTQNRV